MTEEEAMNIWAEFSEEFRFLIIREADLTQLGWPKEDIEKFEVYLQGLTQLERIIYEIPD